MSKIANTQYPVIEVIKNRWSARSFSTESISTETLATLIEAASWAFSANNAQPWKFIVVTKEDKETFEGIVNTLAAGNQPWAKNAAAFIISLAVQTFDNGKPNAWAAHDVGAANAFLLLQATEMNLFGHLMAGFSKEALMDFLHIEAPFDPITVLALGYLDTADALEEPYKTREVTPRIRKSIEEITQWPKGKQLA